jgi:hypothetical protein
MESIVRHAVENDFLNLNQPELAALKASGQEMIGDAGGALYARSLYRVGPTLVAMARIPADAVSEPAVAGPAGAPGSPQRRLVILSPEPVRLGFYGPRRKIGSVHTQEVVPSSINLGPLWQYFSWTKPVSLRNEQTTIGMGDRVGLASSGHIRAASAFRVSPVLAQQSMRELAFTGRSYADVVSDAAFMVFQEGFESGYGADGDHLKNIPDIDRALARGMPMITLDLTEVMRPEAADFSASQVKDAFDRLPADFRSRVMEAYADKMIRVGETEISFDVELAQRCAVMYGDALAFSVEVNDHLQRMTGGAYDLEISIDETTTPTLPSHHLFIARELEQRGVTVNSLAPRFIGEFQKGIDYIGDLDEFERQFKVHAQIAKAAGGYKVSIHSGSDKFSPYPIIGRETGMRLHLKTAGTSWLESLRTIAQTEPALYRTIHQRAYDYYPEALKAYHITADLSTVAPLSETSDADLPAYLEHPAARQLLHISYGGLLRDPSVRGPYYAALHTHDEAHRGNVERHLRKHLELLGVDTR